MGPHRIYCYSKQRVAVEDFLRRIGSIISRDTPYAVSHREQLLGQENINFVVIDGHPDVVPQDMWEVITTRGAIVIHVDDQWMRGRAERGIVPVKHYPGSAA